MDYEWEGKTALRDAQLPTWKQKMPRGYIVSLLPKHFPNLMGRILHGKTQHERGLPLEYKLYPLEATSVQVNKDTKSITMWGTQSLFSSGLQKAAL